MFLSLLTNCFTFFLIMYSPRFNSIGYTSQFVINEILYIQIHLAIHLPKIKVSKIDTYVTASTLNRTDYRFSKFTTS